MPLDQKLRILMIGEESAGVQALNAAALPQHEVVAVMTSSASASRRNTSLATAAQHFGYDIWPAKLVKDPAFAMKVRSSRVDVILNVHSRYIVDEQVINAARIGAFNMHPGPLPQYAGLNCVSWAMYRGETNYAVTLHWMVQEIDAGDVAYQSSFPIEQHDTPVSMTHKCVKAGVPLITTLLKTAVENPDRIPRMPQDLTRRQYFGKEIPDSGRLSWTRHAGDIVNFVRACDYAPFLSPWGQARAAWDNREIVVVKADRTNQKCDGAPGMVGHCDQSGALVASADEWVSVRQLRIDGRYVKPQGILRPGLLLQDGL